MGKHCIYCKTQIDENSVLDVCTRCGIGVWGEKMFNAIVQNMENAREAGDLFQGSVTDQPTRNTTPAPRAVVKAKSSSLLEEAQRALAQQEKEEVVRF